MISGGPTQPVPPEGPTSTLGKIFDYAGNFLTNHGGTLAGVGSIAGALDNAGDIRDLGYAMQNQLQDLGYQLNTGSQFQGYGVTSGLGTSKVFSDGSIQLGMGPSQTQWNRGINNVNAGATNLSNLYGQSDGQTNIDWNNLGTQYITDAQRLTPNLGWSGQYAQDAASLSMADPRQRQQEIFNQIMAIQNPMLDRQQAQQQAREYAMGRGGVAGSAYGGTAEDAAMAKARAQASNEAVLNAMQQADNERTMFGEMAARYGANSNDIYQMMSNRENQLGQLGATLGALGVREGEGLTSRLGMLSDVNRALAEIGFNQSELAYLPMKMQMELLKQAQGTGDQAQTGQLTGQNYLAQLMLGGADANLKAQDTSAQLMGNLYNSLLGNLGGASSNGTTSSGLGGLGGLFGGLLEDIGKALDEED